MKKVMFALCFMLGGIVTLMAQEQQDTTSNQYRTERQSQYPQDALGQDRERIQSTELPDEVKRALEGAEYRGWLVSGAFIAKGSAMQSDTTSTDPNQQGNNNAIGAQDGEVYMVELKNGAETKTVRFDADGQVIEGMEGQDEMQGQDQNNQMNQTDTTNQASPEGQPGQNQSENNQYNQPDQTETEQSPENETEQSTETESDQSDKQAQPDQSTSESQTDRP